MISIRFTDGAGTCGTAGEPARANGYRTPTHSGNLRLPLAPNGIRGRFVRGFTLVEVLVVVAMAVALTAIAVPTYQSYMDEVRLSNVVKDIALISIHLERHRTENRGQLPDALAETPASNLADPWGNSYRYLNIETATGPGLGKVRKDKNLVPLNTDFDLYSMGKDGKSKSPLTAAASRDDIVRANNGGYVGPASEY
jgi:general secretion pathway protein G